MEIEALRFQHARSWSFYALSLDRNCIDEYSSSGLPWKPILQRAREIVQADLAKDLSIINGQIDYCSHYYDPATPFSHDRFQTLCEIFDLPVPHLTDAQQQYVFEDREMVLATIQATLKGEAIPVLEPAVLVTAMTEEVSAIAARFIGEISQMYVGEVGEQNPASQEIKLDLLVPGDSPTERYQKLSAVFPAVILVSYGKHGHHYVGCACLRPYKGSTATAKDLELRYLFVSKPFRKMKMARYILYWAHRYAKEKGYSALVFEALPEFFEGALYLEKRHFSQTQRRGDYGWIVLEYPTARPFKYPGRQEPSESNYVGL
jgi:GNAT superfamily N-acetyltransferase